VSSFIYSPDYPTDWWSVFLPARQAYHSGEERK
jgi:hypothetical protein